MRLGLGTDISVGYRQPLFGGVPLLLDTYTGAAAAYSLRELSQEWIGQPVVRVRRSSDNAEADFTAAEVSDGTLTTWTGANDGFVVTWYDQSGNSRNLTQATAGNQGRIVISGVLQTDPNTGKPAIRGAANFGMSTASFSLSQPVTKFTVSSYLTSASNQVLYSATNLTSRHQITNLISNGGEYSLFAGAAFTPSSANSTNLFNDTVLSFALFNGSSSALGINGNTADIGNGGTYTSVDLSIGVSGGNTASFQGYISEHIVYGSNKSADRDAIEAAINSHYSIY